MLTLASRSLVTAFCALLFRLNAAASSMKMAFVGGEWGGGITFLNFIQDRGQNARPAKTWQKDDNDIMVACTRTRKKLTFDYREKNDIETKTKHHFSFFVFFLKADARQYLTFNSTKQTQKK